MSSLQKLNETSSLIEVRIVKCISEINNFTINKIYTVNIFEIDNDNFKFEIFDDSKTNRIFQKEDFKKFFKELK